MAQLGGRLRQEQCVHQATAAQRENRGTFGVGLRSSRVPECFLAVTGLLCRCRVMHAQRCSR
eukprot:7422323-Alexandrium_andersonii.AAC.1